MLRKLQVSCVLLAWLLATGSQWDLVQVFAWGRMIATYERVMPLREAVRATFTAGNECAICDLVHDAKKDSAPVSNAPAASEKILLILQPAPVLVYFQPVVVWRSQGDPLVPGALRAAPPLPPPRVSVA
jgi:hypothetical protein